MGFSCEFAFQYIFNYYKSGIDNAKSVIAVFLDLRGTFETVDRKFILQKLNKYDIGGNVFTWVNDYLGNSLQMIKYANKISSKKVIDVRVPQGSIVGSFFYSIDT